MPMDMPPQVQHPTPQEESPKDWMDKILEKTTGFADSTLTPEQVVHKIKDIENIFRNQFQDNYKNFTPEEKRVLWKKVQNLAGLTAGAAIGHGTYNNPDVQKALDFYGKALLLLE